MRISPIRAVCNVGLIGLGCVAGTVGLVFALSWLLEPDVPSGRESGTSHPGQGAPEAPVAGGTNGVESRSSVKPAPAAFEIDTDRIEDGGYSMALQFTGSIEDTGSLRELRDAIRLRGRRGIESLSAEVQQSGTGSESLREQVAHTGQLRQNLGLLYLSEGRFAEASASFEEALKVGRLVGVPPRARAHLTALLGIVALRRGEIDNCVECLGPSSCIFPIAPAAVHTRLEGSREAVRRFTEYLEQQPGDLRIRWLLNIAYMTLGEYPEKVPPQFLIPLDTFRSRIDVGRFENVAPTVGLTTRGPNQAGGSIFDDFTGDGRPDIFTTSMSGDSGAALFVNRDDGTFEDRSSAAGLDDQIYSLNASHADFDNDGDLDVLMLRGAWDGPRRMSLLRNRGDGVFDDVTLAAGLARPIASLACAWGDYDNDGLLDLYVCGEYLPPMARTGFGDLGGTSPDPLNLCRLYHNQGDGTFQDVAPEAGVVNARCPKGAAWGDYDADGRLDLLVSNMGQECRLYHNEGDGTFGDVALELGVKGDQASFACWFWDYDNDGRLDLYIHDNRTTLAVTAASALGVKVEGASRPRLYRNLGPKGFQDVTRDVGLDRPMTPMGCNFGDIDNDGFLDIYLGTGWISTSSLVPNLMFKNVDGQRFEDVTMSSGTGHLQKGHGVSFADWDGDGNLDLFVEAGGPVPGDKAHNLLFQNPGHGHHWLQVKLVGTKTNRGAVGAQIHVTRKTADGQPRSVYRTVGNNSSFGGNCLVETIGLLDSPDVTELTVSWPTSKTTQTFRDLAADQMIEIVEGSDSIKVLHPPASGR